MSSHAANSEFHMELVDDHRRGDVAGGQRLGSGQSCGSCWTQPAPTGPARTKEHEQRCTSTHTGEPELPAVRQCVARRASGGPGGIGRARGRQSRSALMIVCSGRLGRCAVIISLRAAPCRDESRDRASANRAPESFINGFVFTLKGLTLSR